MPIIWLIRHGESKSNAGLPTTWPKDVALTDLGIMQAECIAHYLAYEVPLDLIVTSSYQRTKQTAVPAMLRFPSVPEEEWFVHEFTYLSEEEFQGPSDVKERKPVADVYWELGDPTFVDGPGSESFEQLFERVQSVINSIKETRYATIAIFSHEQFIRAFQWITEGKLVTPDEDTMCAFKVKLESDPLPNGAILRAEFEKDQGRWDWELLTTHLMAFV